MPTATFKKLEFGIPFLGLKGTWEVDDQQRLAAWELYIEMITRISVVPLGKDDGILREALNSLYSIFSTTRNILKKYGPSIAFSSSKDELTLGHVAIKLLNEELRPFLSKWHPILEEYESSKEEKTSIKEHEFNWSLNEEFRIELLQLQKKISVYCDVLSEVSGVNNLH